MATDQAEPTATGWALARVAAALPEKERRDLYRLLAHHLHAPNAHDLRRLRLGLIVEIVVEDGEPPGVERYDVERALRTALGEDWPDRTTVSGWYAGWAHAVHAAMDLYAIGTRASVPHHRRHHVEDTRDYTLFEIQEAFVAARDKLGHWPTQSEYLAWASLERRAARDYGTRWVRYPTMPPIRRHFGRSGYARALTAARKEWDAAPSAAERNRRNHRALDAADRVTQHRSRAA